MANSTEFTVNYACDADGDHTSPISECTSSDTKQFSNIREMLDFMADCTYVYNQEELLNTASKSKPNTAVVKEAKQLFQTQF